jgi:hypothetical protein
VADTLTPLKQELAKQIRGGNAHAKLEQVTDSLPYDLQGRRPEGVPYSAWQLLEHLRIAQRDMLDFCRNEDGSYREMKWPDDYWPKSAEPPEKNSWSGSVAQVEQDREDFISLLESATSDLFKKFPWGDGQTLLHEAMLIIDHNSYHLGEIVALRRLLGAWPPKKK